MDESVVQFEGKSDGMTSGRRTWRMAARRAETPSDIASVATKLVTDSPSLERLARQVLWKSASDRFQSGRLVRAIKAAGTWFKVLTATSLRDNQIPLWEGLFHPPLESEVLFKIVLKSNAV
jgi:hypothetical protein